MRNTTQESAKCHKKKKLAIMTTVFTIWERLTQGIIESQTEQSQKQVCKECHRLHEHATEQFDRYLFHCRKNNELNLPLISPKAIFLHLYHYK